MQAYDVFSFLNPFVSAKVGDYVKFGNYPQTEKGEIQPIEWQVLSIENNKMLVISRYGLDAKRFDSSSNNWIDSEIRRWLNDIFYDKAFTEEEKKYINYSSIFTTVDDELIDQSNDYIFLLNYEEADKYFANDNARKCKPTKYAVKHGANPYKGYSDWFLRSVGYCEYIYGVGTDGIIIGDYNVHHTNNSIRPALWINL